MSNMEYFYNGYKKEFIFDEKLLELFYFTSLSEHKRNKLITKNGNIRRNNDNYSFIYNDKEYDFFMLSDKNIQKYDKNILLSRGRYTEYLDRTLKLSCSLDIDNSKVSVGNSSIGIFRPIILFEKNNKEWVIDYCSNIIMEKEKYYELFKYSEINNVSKSDLYKINRFIKKSNASRFIYELLFFNDEIKSDLSKSNIPDLSIYKSEYDKNGINTENYCLIGDNSDFMFFSNVDTKNRRYSNSIDKLVEFTLSKNCTKNIEQLNEHQYKLKVTDSKSIIFSLLSDIVEDESLKELLLTEERYGYCHEFARVMTKMHYELFKDKVKLVSGKIKTNDIDSFYHSWVEIDEVDKVIDFNNNIVIGKDDFYDLFGAEKISETKASKVEEMYNILYEELNLHPMEINFFGNEIMNNLKKSNALKLDFKTNMYTKI